MRAANAVILYVMVLGLMTPAADAPRGAPTNDVREMLASLGVEGTAAP